MPTYRRTTRIAAPIDEVWSFHSTIDGLVALTPDWMHLEIARVEGPDGEPDPEVLTVGSQIEMSMQPLGVLPRQRWTSQIVEREPAGTTSPEGSAYFVDDMVDGPFREWEHTHTFHADGGETILVDSVTYRLPLGAIGDAIGPAAKIGFEGMFRDRHRRTSQQLVDG